jgi:Anti-sigma factor NepR
MVNDVIKPNNKKIKVAAPDEKTQPVTSKPEVYDLIGQKLRVFYDEVANQPVPDRFMDLLNELEKQSTEKKET